MSWVVCVVIFCVYLPFVCLCFWGEILCLLINRSMLMSVYSASVCAFWVAHARAMDALFLLMEKPREFLCIESLIDALFVLTDRKENNACVARGGGVWGDEVPPRKRAASQRTKCAFYARNPKGYARSLFFTQARFAETRYCLETRQNDYKLSLVLKATRTRGARYHFKIFSLLI